MSNMISVASGFQYSVNIGYDLNNDDKLRNFIPTRSSLELLEDILLSTRMTSTERARVLIGAYGKGKSHIVLTIMAMLMKRDLMLFEKTMPKISENPQLESCIRNYYESDNRILPIIISGSNTSLTQAFLLALQRTLAENDLLDVMPETNFKAAVATIERWKSEFPDTFDKFKESIDVPVSRFIVDLENYSTTAYERFERIYPSLTAGSVFNPFLGFDVVDLYEGVVKGLRNKGFTGVYVIYDEFSKFLEANISEASVSDTKMLQDFAEKCNRSGSAQMHLLLISHKEISNYIDTLPKQKVDGWRGVSERFRHIHLNNNFSQTYEIIASVIQKTPGLWEPFCDKYSDVFEGLAQRYNNHALFSELGASGLKQMIRACYPLHPVSTFILPRLSECVAQNERTLFTFLSANGTATLPSFLTRYDDDTFSVITPDLIYDYFEPLFKKEVYSSDLYKTYQLTNTILSKLAEGSLESKIVKTISLIYILEQFEKLSPTRDELVGIFSVCHTVSEVESAIDNLVGKEFVVYLKRSNNYLRLKQTSGVDIHQKIKDVVASQKGKYSVKDTLNKANFDNCIYPSRYNDEREMTRYFSFVFIDESEVSTDTQWLVKGENIPGDGVIYGIIPSGNDSINSARETIIETSKQTKQAIFILPKKYMEIASVVAEFNAVSLLRDAAADDKILFDEYEVIYEDLREVIAAFIKGYTQPETLRSRYYHDGHECSISRKAALTGLLSDICDEVFSMTPIINNEAINRDEITSVAHNSRSKIIAALLRSELESGLGLTGSGQEVSIMRSTLVRTGILVDEMGVAKINLNPADINLAKMLGTIVGFIKDAQSRGQMSFGELYHRLIDAEYHIGMRKGLIPIYLAAVLHEFKQSVLITDRFGQVSTSTDVLLQINADPNAFSVKYLDWNPEKEAFIVKLADLFQAHVIDAEKANNSYDYVVGAMRRWYMSLPKYSKDMKRMLSGERVDGRYLAFMRLLRQNIGTHELLFQRLPEAFGYAPDFTPGVCENIAAAKDFFDSATQMLRSTLIRETKEMFMVANAKRFGMTSLSSVIKDWCESLDATVFEQLFPDGTDKCLILFKSVTNDEDIFIARLAKIATDLRLEDWDDSTHKRFTRNLSKYKETAEQYHAKAEQQKTESVESNYQVQFVDDNGTTVTKRFDRVEISKRGKLLLNAITSDIDSMGHSVSEQEKRQILMEVLKKMC